MPPELLVGIPAALSPLVRRIVAPNPGMMTGAGTNTYLVGVDEVAVIDPGPEDAGHLEAILGCGGDRIRWVVCTHTHLDHWPGAAALAARTGAEILAFDSRDGLEVDGSLADGDQIEGTEFRLTAVHTPGHASNHLCYLLEEERLLFSGDHVMNGSTVVIRPPDGDMAAYVEQLERLKHLRLRAIAPGHGELITEPIAKLDEYLAHRRLREDIVVAALAEHGPATTAELLVTVYADVTEDRHEMARHSLWAHLRKLASDGRATAPDVDDPDGRWEMVTP
ncbi:MAG: fold metallo-hydrolase [Actinomycetia bacterium]|nr:fold metallo-hydrolase [Actinomycetes bacterium]